MTRDEASEILELSPHASPAERAAQHDTLRRQLEDKLAKAPTPGLREKYRASLKQLEEAAAVLAQSDDSAALPVLKKESGDRKQETGAQPLPSTPQSAVHNPQSTARPSTSSSKKSGSKEFAIVAVIAVVVLGAGGWWVMKTKAENEEKARIAAEARAAAEKIAEEKRLAAEAEQKRIVEESRLAELEKEKAAAAAKAEQERLDKVAANVRVQLAETKLAWEQLVRTEREAERTLSDLKAERSGLGLSDGRRNELIARIEAWTAHSRWLADFLASHPMRLVQLKTSELLAARQFDTAAQEAGTLLPLVAAAKQEIAARQAAVETQLWGTLLLQIEPADDTWVVTDAFGRRYEGKGPARLENLARGQGTLVISRGVLAQTGSFTVKPGAETIHQSRMLPAEVVITANAPGAVAFEQGRELGRLPLTLKQRPPGSVQIEVRAPRFLSATVTGVAQPGKKLELAADLAPESDSSIILRHVHKFQGQWVGPKANSAGSLRVCLTINAEKTTAVRWLKGWPQLWPPRDVPLVLIDRENETIGVRIASFDLRLGIRDGKLIVGDETAYDTYEPLR